jgi:hypothetical protein
VILFFRKGAEVIKEEVQNEFKLKDKFNQKCKYCMFLVRLLFEFWLVIEEIFW